MNRQPRWSLAALVGAFVLSPLGVRALLMIEGQYALQWADLRGAAADVGVSLLFGSIVAAVGGATSWFRPVGTALVAGWCVANFANYEHIRELGSMANLSHASYLFDPVFFRASVLAPTHPALLVLTTLTSTVLAWFALDPDLRPRLSWQMLAGGALLVVVVVIPATNTVAGWRQTDFVIAQGARAFTNRVARDTSATGAHGGLAVRDLEGAPIVMDGQPARNVLLIILEGVSGAYLPSLAAHHGRSPLLIMPKLDLIAQRGISFPSFVATQRQTNRGEYALLCGEYPKLLTSEANMSQLVGRGPLDCLPSELRAAGFSTHYLQAAPLPFMFKDQFMLQAGFEQVRGDEWFQHSYNRNHWGVDDRAFFEASLDMIDELKQREAPWFLTLLTVGTHHRYNVPPSFEGTHETGSAAWAFEYLDHAIGDFVSSLDAAGVLENTLVLITSDESQSMDIGAPDTSKLLSQGWGLLIALLPTGQARVVDGVFAQPDIPISVTDYLGLEDGRQIFTGRSVFRRYDRAREVFWGNTHLGMVAGLTVDNELVMCTEDFVSCSARLVVNEALFAPGGQLRAATDGEVDWLRDAAYRSLHFDPGLLQRRRLQLISAREHPIVRVANEQYLFGGQFLSVPAYSVADVEIEVSVTGSTGWVDLVHNFVVNLQPYYSRSARIRAGETLHLRYSVATKISLENVESRLWVTGSEGDGLSLEFSSAEISISPLAPSEGVAEIVEHEFEITGGDRNQHR